MRHSQGDHWDLCIIYPSGSFTEYYSRERVAKRQAAGDASGVPNAEFARRFYSMISWHEDLYAAGPPLEVFREHVKGMGLAHFEMLLALAGKRDELIKERQMENVFNRERGRGGTLIFVHDQGAAWDVITLGRVPRLAALRGAGDDSRGGQRRRREEGRLPQPGGHRPLHAHADLDTPRHAGPHPADGQVTSALDPDTPGRRAPFPTLGGR